MLDKNISFRPTWKTSDHFDDLYDLPLLKVSSSCLAQAGLCYAAGVEGSERNTRTIQVHVQSKPSRHCLYQRKCLNTRLGLQLTSKMFVFSLACTR